MLSLTSRYALHALYTIARSGGQTTVREISGQTGIPTNYLSKILHALAREGILRSARGLGGGFQLARAPEAIPLIEIVRIFEDRNFFARCLLGGERCPEGRVCAAHDLWAPIVEETRRFFEMTTLADLLAEREPAAAASEQAALSERV